ncbi:MAG: hypothetical protein ACJAWL_003497 [Motiliproteus sp.]|jgi:hypothetical protein
MEIKDFSFVVMGLCGAYAGTAAAIDPASMKIGEMAFTPQVWVQLSHNDNIFTEETDTNSSFITLLNPSVDFRVEKGNRAFRLNYDLKQGIIHSSSADNYTDHRLTGEAIFEMNSRNQLNLTAGVNLIHEDRGSTDASTGDEPSVYNDNSIAGTYLYGAKSAQGNLELTASYLDHQYTNFAAANDGRDRDNLRLGATFFYNVAPKTQALFEVRHEQINYKQSSSTLDNDEQKYLVGVKWDATAKSSGSAKIGATRKTYDATTRSNQSGISWEVATLWEPQTYSSFELETSQEYDEASGSEDAVDTQNLSLTWTHSWSERVSTNAMLSDMNEDYLGLNREDKTDSVALSVDYELQRWLSVNLGYAHADSDSDITGESYKDNQFMVTLRASL